ncbi:hypothetical protein [Salininema proteolyticum]|uniref:YbaB/EbfC DNA-binding family protein n=1 Tax=Salininema proteolyticum TaxID=1607685 RepID=A0ABV8TUI0_9ACTN
MASPEPSRSGEPDDSAPRTASADGEARAPIIDENAECVKEVFEGKVRITARYPGEVAIEVLEPLDTSIDTMTVGHELSDGVNAALEGLRTGVFGGGDDVDTDLLAGHFEKVGAKMSHQIDDLFASLMKPNAAPPASGGKSAEPKGAN